MKQLTSAQQQQIARFNKRYKVGDTIQLLNDWGESFSATVTHGAQDLYGQMVVYLDKPYGAYDLERVQSKY